MENKCKRFLSLLLAFVMVLGMFPVGHAHAEAVVGGNTINMLVGDEYTFENLEGDYSALTGDSVISVDVEFTPQMTGQYLEDTTTNETLESGKYILMNTRSTRFLESTSANNKLWLAAKGIDTAEKWVITSVDGGYTMQASNGQYMTFDGSSSGLTDTETVLNFVWKSGTSTWQIGLNGQYLNSYDSEQKVAGWHQDGDSGSQWKLYKMVAVPAYTWTLGEQVSEIKDGGYYILENNAASSRNANLVSGNWSNTGNGGGGSGFGLKLVNNKTNFNEQNIWKITGATGNYNVQHLRGWNLLVASGKATLTADRNTAVIGQDSGNHAGKWQISVGGVHLNWWGGANGDGVQTAGWGDVNDGNSQWNIYEVTKTALGTSDVTIKADALGTTEITIGGITYTVKVNEFAPEEEIKFTTEQITGITGDASSNDAGDGSAIAEAFDGVKNDNGNYWASVRNDNGIDGNEYLIANLGGKYLVNQVVYTRRTAGPAAVGNLIDYTIWVSADNGSTWTEVKTGTMEDAASAVITFDAVPATHVKLTATQSHHWQPANVNKVMAVAEFEVFKAVCIGEHDWDEGVVVTKPSCVTEGEMQYTCSVCYATKTDAIPVLTAKSAQPLMSGWTFGTVSLADCEFTVSKNDGSYVNRVVSHGGNYYVKPAADTNAKPQQNAFFGAIALEFQNNGKVRIRGYGQDTGYLHMWNVGEVCADTNLPYWDKCSSGHGDGAKGTDEFYLLKANPDSTFTGVPGYEQVTTRDQLVFDESYLIAAVNKSGVWFVMYPSTEAVSIAKVVDDAVTHTHSFTSEENVDCGVAGTKTETCECGHVHISELPPEPHHGLTHVEAKAPTCVENGNIEYWYCTNCGGAWLDAECLRNTNLMSVTLPANGEHVYENYTSNGDATCTSNGTETGKCACGAEDTREAANSKLNHTNGTPVKENEVAPTLNTEGSYDMVVYCTVCGAEVSRKTETIPALTAVAEINGVKYATLQDAFDAVKDMETITLLVDVELDTYLNVNNPGVIALNLNGHNIKRPYEIGSGNTGIVAIYVNGEDTTLDIYGEGSVTAELAVWAASGIVIIEDGKYYGYGDTIYTSGTGYIEIWGGEFSAEETTHTQNKYSVLNKKDGSDSEIVVVGGSFIGFNPANNFSEGTGTNFVEEGYCSRENEGVWTVVEGHDWNDADCTNPKTCTVCGATDGEALGHAWTATAYENKGENHITTYTCGNDATHTDSKTEAHTYVNGKCVCGAEEIEVVYVAKIGEQGYETLAKAITAANTGDTIVLLADINENVNVSKSVIIDGAEKNYTGTMTIGNSKNVTVQNVNFVKGSIVEAKGNSSGTLTIKNCDFDGVDKSIIYAVTMDTSSKVIVEGCTAKGYDFGFLYIKRAVTTVNVKDTAVEGMNYGVSVAYGNKVNLENVKMTNMMYGVYTWNFGAKNYSLTNCEISAEEPIATFLKNTAVDTFKFYGTNTLTATADWNMGEYLKFVLPEMGSVLVAPAGLDVITTVEGYVVSYENGAYFVDEPKAPVAQVGEQTFTSIQAAIDAAADGDVITIIADHELDGTKPVTENTYGYDTLILIEEKNVTIDFNGHTVAVTPACDATTNGSNGVMLESIIFLGKGSKLTLKDSVGNGGFQVNKGTALYSMVYNSKSTLTIENGIYNVAETVIAGALVYADLENTTAFRGGEFTLGNAGIDAESTKPWIFNVEGKNSGNFVEVTGGTYNQDLLLNYGTKKDCEVYIPEGYVLVDNENGTWSVVEGKRVVMIQQTGEKFGTLADAIAAANAGDTIVLLADINENVTVSKSVTIDGAKFNYTGTMKINTNLTVTVKNVDFVAGCIDKNGSKGTLTVKDCTFDAGEKTINYAITARGGSKVTVEGCSASGYNFGFLYIPKSVATVNVKDTVVDGMNYGVSVAYANKVNLENVKMTNMKYGVYTWNFGAKNYSLTNCEISAAAPIATFLKATAVDTFNFYGTNTLNATADWNLGEYLKFVLPAMDSKLVAPAGLDVTTTVEGYVVSYENGTYFVDEPKAPVAQVGEQTFTSIQAAVEAAQDGETVVLLTDVELGWNDVVTNADGYTVLVNVVGKSITLDLAGYTISVDHQSDADRIYSVICVEDGASLTVTGNGGIDVDVNDEAPKVAYMFWKRGTTGTMVIENGSYHMDNSEDSMVYTNGSEIVTVKGGTFILDAVGTRANGFPWTFNTAGNNQRNIVVIGGTYNYDITNQYWKYEVNIPEGYFCEDNGNGTWSVVEDNRIAQNLQTGEKFETLAEAIAAVKNGETIVLLADCAENVTIKQVADKSFTIDGDGKTYTGTITIDGNKRSTGKETLTIQNVKFVRNGGNSIVATKNTYVHNLTVDGCYFEGADYGMSMRHTYNITVKNTTAKSMSYGLYYAPLGVNGLTVENVTVTESTAGFRLDYLNKPVSFKDVNLNVTDTGVRVVNYTKGTVSFDNCAIAAATPVELYLAHASNVVTLDFNGTNTIADNWLKITGTGADVIVDLTDDANLDIAKVIYDDTFYGVKTEGKVHTFTELPAVAAINGTEYKSIQAAIDAAVDGDVITIIADHELDGTKPVTENTHGYDTLILIEEKNVTIDFNGHTVAVTPACDATTNGSNGVLLESIIFLGKSSNLTLTDSVGNGGFLVNEGTDLYSLIYNSKSTLTIENGIYNVAETVIAGALVYADLENTTAFRGGEFTLGNAGIDAESTKPWIFNVEGKNSGNFVEVTGGTYNQDLLLNYGTMKDCEIYIPEGYILVDNENGTWTVRAGKWIAEIAETGKTFETLAEAIAAVKNGETVVLLDDCAEDVTIKQTSGKSFTIDGNGKTYTGTITIDGNKRYNGSETLTIKNFNFIVEGTSIETLKNTQAHNITIDGCNFTGTDGSNYDYAIYLRHSRNVTVKNTTGTNLYDLVYGNSSATDLVVDTVTVTDSVNGIWLSYVAGTAEFKNVTTDVEAAGVGFFTNAAGTVTFEGCAIDTVVYANNKGTASMTLVFNDEHNVLNISATGERLTAVLNQPNATITAVEGLNVIPSEELAKSYEVVYENGVYRLSHAIARNEATGKLYMDLSDALAEAADGQTVTLLKETAEDLVLVPAGVTFDLNGNVVTAGNVLSFGIVKDTAANVGGIKISNNTEVAFTKLQPENGGYLPIYDTRDGMYKFFAYELANADGIKLVGNSVKFGIKLSFENEAAFEVMANTEDSGITMSADVTWTGMNVPNVNFKLDKALTVEYALKKAANPSKNYAITLTIGGLDNLQAGDFIRVTPILTTNTEVGCRIDTNEYIKD